MAERGTVIVYVGLATASATSNGQAPVTDHERERQQRNDRRYYERHRDALLENRRQWIRDNPETARERRRRYDADPVQYAKRLERNRKSRARRAAAAIAANGAGPACGAAIAQPPIPAAAANVASV